MATVSSSLQAYITTPQDVPSDRATAVAQVIADLQAVLSSAQQDLANTTLSRDQIATARQIVAEAQSAITIWRQDSVPGLSPTQITVQPFDTVALIAQQKLGSPLRYREILALNNRTGWGLNPGDVLLLPVK